MHPVIVEIGPFTVYSFGLMLGIALLLSSWILNKEFERKRLNPADATTITLFAVIFGISGSKLFYLFEAWDEFMLDPLGTIFSPGGLTFYGGLLVTVLAIYIYIKKKKLPFLTMADCAGPALAVGYGVGRIGCHLAGDGDYGIPTSLPWGTDYSNGTAKPSIVFQGSEFEKMFPQGFVPDNTPLHPTPVYEFMAMMLIFWLLWRIRKKGMPDGQLFMLYFIFQGIERFFIEFIRLNDRLLLGLSEAQLISILLIFGGIYGYYYLGKKNAPRYETLKAEAKQKHPKEKHKK